MSSLHCAPHAGGEVKSISTDRTVHVHHVTCCLHFPLYHCVNSLLASEREASLGASTDTREEGSWMERIWKRHTHTHTHTPHIYTHVPHVRTHTHAHTQAHTQTDRQELTLIGSGTTRAKFLRPICSRNACFRIKESLVDRQALHSRHTCTHTR